MKKFVSNRRGTGRGVGVRAGFTILEAIGIWNETFIMRV